MSKGTCLVCFAENINIFDIRNTHLETVYEEISDFKIQTDSHCLCYICYARLQQCNLLMKQTVNIKRSCQGGSNEVENKCLVKLSTINMENTSIDGDDLYPYHVTIKQEPDVKEESLGCLNEEYFMTYPEDFKQEDLRGPSTSYSSCHADLKEDDKEENTETLKVKNAEKTTHNPRKRNHYICDICNKSFSQRYSLTLHKRTHTGEKPYICDICYKSFCRSDDLTKHRRMHTGEKPYICDICDKNFSQIGSLQVHRRTHTKEKPYSCDICNERFTLNGSLKQHKRTRHTDEKLYSCDICYKKFTRKSGLIKHRRTHTGEKPYSCDICYKSFGRSEGLKIHRRTHGEKQYSCDICNKKFAQTSSLKIHKKIHTGDKQSLSVCVIPP